MCSIDSLMCKTVRFCEEMDNAFTVGYDIIKTGFCDIQEPPSDDREESISVEICFFFGTRAFEIDFWRIGVYKKP